MAYLAVFRRGAWGDVTLADTWTARLHDAPLEWLVVVAAAALWTRHRNTREFRAATPFLLFGLLMLGVTFKVYATGPRYALPVLAPLLVGSGITLGLVLERFRTRGIVLAGLLMIGIGAETWLYAQAHISHPDVRAVHVLEALRSQNLRGPILIPQEDVPFLHYYFPDLRFKVYRNEEERNAALSAGGLQAELVQDPAMPVQLLP
jgi:hypothetical protein